MGTLLILFSIILLKFMILGLINLGRCRDSRGAFYIKKYCTKGLIWQDTLAYFFSAYMEIVFSLLLHSNHMNWTDKGNYFPNISFYCFTFIVVALPIWLAIFLWTRYDRLNEDYYLETYGNIYNGINTVSKPAAIFRPVLFLLRRLVIALVCFFMRDLPPTLAIIVLLLNQLLNFCYNLHVKPLY
jgi:magnesium-transporting ATPase (P-type)